LIVDAANTPRVVFGNRPLPAAINNVRASYRVCAGARGNVAAGALSQTITEITALASVTNPVAAAGGSDTESADSAISNAPLLFRSVQRAVTAADYIALAQRTGTVAKARVHSPAWNRVELYVAPAGDVLTPLSESLRNYLLAYFDDKRQISTNVQVFGARPAPIAIACAVVVDERFVPAVVVANVRTAVAALLGFERVDFAQTLYLSDIYAVVESVAGVVGTTVERFRRADRPTPDVDAELARSGLPPLAQLPELIRAAVSTEIEGTGRIDLGEFEIPVLGTLVVEIRQR
jgi:predicted phage baseplate assembly protein